MASDPFGISMDRMGSGTTWVPDAAALPSHESMLGKWMVVTHGWVFGQYDMQSGPRGDTQLGSLNWGMFMASRGLAGGRFQGRMMLSLDALGVTKRGYPLLLQTGESIDGQSLYDRQHPHDFFMEVGVLYERPITKSVGLELYAAPSGEPALGPVAFMHRPSAMDNPYAPISHHWQDATHISFGVLTAGLFTRTIKIEASVFNGREPDEHRWNIDPIHLDSWSARATINPGDAWSFTAGYGFMKSPEAMNPEESMERMTASALHGRKFGANGHVATTAVYGANRHEDHEEWSHSALIESEAILDRSNTLMMRAEAVQKSREELGLALTLDHSSAATHDHFTVGALSLGYIREIFETRGATFGIGALGTLNVVPSSLETTYGSRTPTGLSIFGRVRPAYRKHAAQDMRNMKMAP